VAEKEMAVAATATAATETVKEVVEMAGERAVAMAAATEEAKAGAEMAAEKEAAEMGEVVTEGDDECGSQCT